MNSASIQSLGVSDNDKPGVGDDDVELGFMTSETVMTPIPWYCGNRPTVTLANISLPIDVAVVDDDGSYDHNDHILTMAKISRWQ